MKKLFILTLILCTLTACGNMDSGSAADSVVNDPADSSVSESSSAERCTIYKDNNYMYQGIDFDDAELMDKINGFIGDVQAKYEPSERTRGDDPAGAYLKIGLDSDPKEIYINDSETPWVSIGSSSYETAEGETAEFYQYISDFLSDNGYAADHVVNDLADSSISEENNAANESSQAEYCTIYKDNNSMYQGIDFDDAGLMDKIDVFISDIQAKYEPSERIPSENDPAGAYLKITLSSSDTRGIYILDSETPWVSIYGSSYETAEGETAQFYQYISDFLAENGY